MKSIFLPLLGIASAALLSFKRFTHGLAVNIAEGTHDAAVNKTTDAAFSTRHLLAKIGSDIDHIAISTAAVRPLGSVPDEPASGDLAAVLLLGKGSTKKMVASGAIAAGALVATDAAGKVQTEPTTAGTYYIVGRALNAASADGDIVEVQDCEPLKLVVIAAATSGTAVATTAATNSSPYGYAQAQADAIVAQLNKVQVDIAALYAGLAGVQAVKIAS